LELFIITIKKLIDDGVSNKKTTDHVDKNAEDRGLSFRFCSTDEVTKKTRKFLNFKREYI
jgi:hypothetical protein